MDIKIFGTLKPRSELDKYPIVDSLHILDGHKSVSSISERNNIPFERRREGMTVYVIENKTTYRLKNGITNQHWEEITTDIIDDNINSNNKTWSSNLIYNQLGKKINFSYNDFNENTELEINFLDFKYIPNVKIFNNNNQEIEGIVIYNLNEKKIYISFIENEQKITLNGFVILT